MIPRVSGIVGTRLPDDRLGVYVSGLWSRGDTANSELFARFATRDLSYDTNGDHVADRVDRNVLVPSRISTSKNDGKITGPAFTGGLQFKPDDRHEIGADFAYSKFLNQQDRSYADIQLNGGQSIHDGVAQPGAYAYRSDYFQAPGSGADRSAQPTFTRGYGQLNASISYKFLDHLEASITGTNLTRADRRDYIVDPQMFPSFIQRSLAVASALRACF